MKKEIFLHFLSFLILFMVLSLLRGWWSLNPSQVFAFIPLWIGGITGTFLPDLDHLIYIYFLRPQELTSQRATYMLEKRNISGVFSLLSATRSERKDLIFHTATFQIIFLLLTFFVLTSSGALLGRGLVLAFSLHLVVDQIIDLSSIGTISNWTRNLPVALDATRERYYIFAGLVIVIFFAILF